MLSLVFPNPHPPLSNILHCFLCLEIRYKQASKTILGLANFRLQYKSSKSNLNFFGLSNYARNQNF